MLFAAKLSDSMMSTTTLMSCAHLPNRVGACCRRCVSASCESATWSGGHAGYVNNNLRASQLRTHIIEQDNLDESNLEKHDMRYTQC